MADEIITVEWISTAQQMLATIQKVDAKLERQEKVMQKLTDTSKKGADAAAGSFNKLEQILRKNEAALKDMSVGSGEFDAQKAKVDRLRDAYEKMKASISGKTGAKQEALIPDQKGSLADIESQLKAVEAQLKKTASTSSEFKKLEAVYGNLKKRHDEMTASLRKLGTEAPKVAVHAAGSFNKLEQEVREAEAALQGLTVGTKEFDAQKAKVDQLRGSLKNVKKDLQTIEPEVISLAGSFNRLEKEIKDNEEQLKKLAIGSAEFDKQKRKVDALRASLDKANKELSSKKESPWPTIGKSMVGATAAAIALATALLKIGEAQKQIVATGADQILNLDTMARKMQIQAGLTDPQRQEQSAKVIQQASGAGVRAEVGFQAATQLAGSGFANAVDSGTLTTILDTIQASSFQGAPDQLVSAFSEALNAYGLAKTNANLQQIAVASQSLFKQTDFQLTELADFAKNASVFEGANIKIDEALAGFTALREVLPAAESGTGLRNFVNKLQAGDLTKENKQNLERIGVDAGQVDFVGESLTQVLRTVKESTDKMPEADRNAALGKMFGTENVASARLLINSADRIEQLQKSQQDGAQFAKDRDTAATGMQAQRNRIENQALLQQMPIADQLNELDLQNRQRAAEVQRIQEEMVANGGAQALIAGAVPIPSAIETVATIGRSRGESATGRGAVGAIGDTALPGMGYLWNSIIDSVNRQTEQQVQARQQREAAVPKAVPAAGVQAVEERRITDNADATVKQADTNQDGKIVASEVQKMVDVFAAKGELTDEMLAAIKSIHTEGQGFARPDEMTKTLTGNKDWRDALAVMRPDQKAVVAEKPKQQTGQVEPIAASPIPQQAEPNRGAQVEALVPVASQQAESIPKPPQLANGVRVGDLKNSEVATESGVIKAIASETRMSKEDRALLTEQNRLMAEQNQLMAQQKTEQPAQRQQIPVQKQRPQVAPLPAATAP